MTEGLLYMVGTFAAWLGWAMALRAVYLLIRIVSAGSTEERNALFLGLMSAAAVGAASFLASWALLRPFHDSALRLPLVWPVMPFEGWMAVLCLAAAVTRACQAVLAIEPLRSRSLYKGAFGWLLGSAIFGWLFRQTGAPIEILKGGIESTAASAAGVFLLAVLAVGSMGQAAKAGRARGLAKGALTHIVLIFGSIVFGLPFLWLVITSFKEDQDMSSPNGLVWIPKVSETVPYMDPKNPEFEAVSQGTAVRGSIIQRLANGDLKLDISKPQAMRGQTLVVPAAQAKEVPRDAPVVTGALDGHEVTGIVIEEMPDGHRRVQVTRPAEFAGRQFVGLPSEVAAVRNVGLNWRNYPDALDFLPPETNEGLVYLNNTLLLVVLNVIGTVVSSSIVAYAFSRMRFPGKGPLFLLLLSTMMLPAAVTLLPQFLIFRQLGWIDSLKPLWVPAFFGSAFNIFLLRQFFRGIPMELEDAAKIDGAGYLRTFWTVMLPQIKPALAVIAIWTVMGSWNNFLGPLIYVNSPEHMPIAYALQLFKGDRSNEPGLLMAFTTLSMLPVLALFFFAQRYFIEGVALSGLGGR